MTDPGNTLPPPGDKKTKSLREMAAEGDANPWVCRRCGCCDWRVESSYVVVSGNRRRRRICRHCGKSVLRTEEIPREGQ